MLSIDRKKLSLALQKILDQDGLSIDELSSKSGISKATLYNIFSGKNKNVQRAIVRKIADATNRKFVINGDHVSFQKKEADYDQANMNKFTRRVIELFNSATPDEQRMLCMMMDGIWRTIKEEKAGLNND